MSDQYLFSWKAVRPLRSAGDYPNRSKLVCNQCSENVFQGSHAGRPSDAQYFYHHAISAANAHLADKHNPTLTG